MVDILHRVGVKTPSAAAVYDALATVEGLAGWWTEDTTGSSALGGVIKFRFDNGGGADMEVVELRPAERVVWRVVAGPDEWVNTTIAWDLRVSGDYTVVLFRHAGWREPVEFMHHCTTKWGTFLLSLKALVETGQGTPWPLDRPLGDWR